MIEKIVLDYLNGVLDVPCYMEVPEKPIAPYVVIEKTGNGFLVIQGNKILSGTLAIQSYGTSLYNAAELDEEVKTAMESIVELDSVYRCRLAGSYNFTDTSTKRYRYQSVFDMTY